MSSLLYPLVPLVLLVFKSDDSHRHIDPRSPYKTPLTKILLAQHIQGQAESVNSEEINLDIPSSIDHTPAGLLHDTADMEKFEEKMKAAGLSEAAIGAFRLNYEQLVAGVTGLVSSRRCITTYSTAA